MGFILEVGADAPVVDPTPADLWRAVEALDGGPNSFLVLRNADEPMSYMQTAGSASEGFVLEYQAGGLDQHFACTDEELDPEQIAAALTAYLRGDSHWQSEFAWKLIEL